MRRINVVNNNTPEAYDDRFPRSLGIVDMERMNLLSKYYTGGTYVELGCFDSPLPPLLAERYPKSKIYGIDHSPKLIEFLAKRFPKVKYEVGEVMDLRFFSGTVDYISAGELIEHLDDPKAFVKECMRILKPGGWLAISTPFEEKGQEVGGPMHVWAYTVEDIKEILGTQQVEVIQEETFKTIVAWVQKENTESEV